MKPRSVRRLARSKTGLSPLEQLEDRRLLATFHPLASAPDGSPQSLRAAIIAANSNGQDNTIVLQTGTYELTIPNTAGHESAAAQGDLNLTGANHTITFQGAGDVVDGSRGATFIDGGKIDRVFQVSAGVTAIFDNLIIQNGIARDNGVNGALAGQTDSQGGGIFNAGTVVLNRVKVTLCLAVGGAGQPGQTSAPAGTAGTNALGAGIYSTGDLTLNQSVVTNCIAGAGNGGDGAVTDNSSGAGGAGGYAEGGGIYDAGTSLTVTRSTIELDYASGGNGGNGGAGLFAPGTSGGTGEFANGGGLYADGDPQIHVVDSTVAENAATGGAGGTGGTGGSLGTFGLNGGAGGNAGVATGGGIALALTTLNLDNSTVADNQVGMGAGGQGGTGGVGFMGSGAQGAPGASYPLFTYGGGIADGYLGYLASVSSLIADNIGRYNSSTGLYGPSDAVASFKVASNTLLGEGAAVGGITNGVDGNIVGVDPKIEPIGFNGGPTPTIALSPQSPAIDAGSNPLGLTTDQRGYGPRAVGGLTDIGAYEVGATAPTPVRIAVKVVKAKGVREIEVFNAGTNVLRFAVYPFGKSYRGTFQVQERDINGDGVADVIVTRPSGRNHFVTVIFSGLDGSQLPINMA